MRDSLAHDARASRIAVVGAGISGLAAARTLASKGHAITIFERNAVPGGRIATLTEGAYVWDTGATLVAPRGKSLESVMLRELATDQLHLIDGPVYLHDALRPQRGDPRFDIPRYCYRDGNATLPRLLAAGLDVRYQTAIEAIERDGHNLLVAGESFETVILATTMPQATALLWSLDETRPTGGVSYRPCLSVALGFAAELPPPPYRFLLDPDQRHPITWLSLESLKSPDRAPEGHTGLVVQLSPEFSRDHFESPEEWIVSTTLRYMKQLYGEPFETPDAAHVVRWRYSHPERTATFEHVNHPGARVLIAGDGLLAARVEDAYEVGVRVAEMI